VFDVISDGNLDWAPMDAHYDRIILGDKTYDYVAGREEFKAEIKRHFPAEAAAIDRYVDLLSEVSAKVPRFFAGQALPRSLGVLYSKLRRYWLPDYFFKPTLEVLEGLTDNRELIGLLTAQWGDYGLPPAQAAFVMHAMVAKHYITGGNYPVGGAIRIAETIIPVIEAAGGQVFTYAGVDKIIVENGRAVGVRLQKDGVELRAPQIVSCAGLIPTYTRLIPTDVAAQHNLLAPLQQVEPSAATLCLYAGFKGSAAELGLPKTNYWVYPSFDHDANISAFKNSADAPMPLIYMSFPSAKDPSWDARYPNKATVEIVAATLPARFAQWQGSTWGKRGADYEALKAQLTEHLLETLYQHQPQLRGQLDFCELATPLSTEWFQWNVQGEIYGIDHTVKRFDQHWIHSQTPIKGLYLTGADTVTAGVGGALMAGVLTASRMLGWRGYRVGQLLKRWQRATPTNTEAEVSAG
jgi:all-trans-retinol 13,14-reductase